jgi:hypothetical protein
MSALDDLAEIQRLAELPAMEYGRQRNDAAKKLGIGVGLLDREVAKVRKTLRHSNTRTAGEETLSTQGVGDRSNSGSNNPPVRTLDELYSAAQDIIEAPDVLEQVDLMIRRLGYAGDRKPVLLVYVAITSRLLDKPINAHIIAPSATGKNYTLNTALQLIPEEAVRKMTASTPKALIYSDIDLRHKTVVLAECDSISNLEGSAATLVRSIIEDAKTDYDTVEKDPETGRNVTRRVSKEGPTGLVTTGVRELEFQTATRVLTIFLSDTPEQTREILLAEVRRASGRIAEVPSDLLIRFADYQRWLAAQPLSAVVVPFAEVLAERVSANETRMRRDFKQLLAAVKTIALLNQHQRERDPMGRIIAQLEDYSWARTLLLATFKSVTGGGVTEAVRQTVMAVPDAREVTEMDLVRKLSLSRSTISYRVGQAIRGGWLCNHEQRKGHPGRLVRGAPLPEDVSPLPTSEEVEGRVCAVRTALNSNAYSNGHQASVAVA